jgi:hypothetical protein
MIKRVLELQLLDNEGESKLILRKEEESDVIALSVFSPKISITSVEMREALDILDSFKK